MVSKLHEKYMKEITFDMPIEYKGLKIYPVPMEEYFNFNFFIQSILLEKNSIPDVKVISMSYLEFMYKYTTPETPYAVMFRELLSMCLRVEAKDIKIAYNENMKPIFVVNETEFNNQDFEEIKLIICEQNLVDIPDEKIQKEIRDKIEEARKLRAKMNGSSKLGTLEDFVVSVMISTSLKIEDIYKLSIRKFNKILQRLDHKLHYEIYLSASMSGMVKFKDKSFLKHWLADLSKDGLDETIGLDSMKDHISFKDLK